MVAAIESGALEAEAEPGLTHVVPLAADEAENESMLMYDQPLVETRPAARLQRFASNQRESYGLLYGRI